MDKNGLHQESYCLEMLKKQAFKSLTFINEGAGFNSELTDIKTTIVFLIGKRESNIPLVR